jgi:multiple sugar transport system substrate-binding protein
MQYGKKVVSRRSFLTCTVFGAAGTVIVAACQGAAPPVQTPAGQAPAPTSAAAAKPPAATQAPVAAATVAKSSAPVELTVTTLNRPPWLDLFKQFGAQFSAANPGVTVKVEGEPDNFGQVVLARVAAGTVGDIGSAGSHYQMASRAIQHLYRPIDDLVAAEKYDLKQHFDVAIKACTVRGQLVTLPFTAHTGWNGFFYVKDLFDASGVAYPTDKWTYDDLIAAAQKLTKRSGSETTQWGFWLGAGYEPTAMLANAWGSAPQNSDGTKPTWTDPETVASLQWHADVYNNWKVSPQSPANSTAMTLWSGKQAAMILLGMFSLADLTTNAPPGTQWAGFLPPLGPSGKRAGYVSVDANPIWAISKHPEEAWKFTKFVTTKESGLRLFETIGNVGPRPDVWADPKMQSQELLKPFGQLLPTLEPYPVPANGRQEELWDMATNQTAPIWIGEKSVADGAAEVQRQAENIFAEPSPGS